jgi:hypothetical protein
LTVSLRGILTAQDHFAGRSDVRYGIGEPINLTWDSVPPMTAAQLGGLRWFQISGNGTLINDAGDTGLGTYTCHHGPETVVLELRNLAGTIRAPRNTITVIRPSGERMVRVPGSGLRHATGTWSVGFRGDAYLSPTDVSFHFIERREGTVAAVATGYLALWNGIIHATGNWIGVGTGNSTDGCMVLTIDTVFSGELQPPYAVGDFVWAIPREHRVVGSGAALVTHVTGNHHATASAVGRATIAKLGAGPFSRVPTDPTSTY